jgi:SAM-dependent methyltransferase
MLPRLKALMYAPDRLRRIAHFAYGKILFNLPINSRKHLFKGNQYFCPICGNSISKFLDLYRPYHLWCPICQSLQRHRFLWIFYQSKFFEFPSTQHRFLHIAPEPALAYQFKKIANLIYTSADLNDRRAMIKMDICDIHFPDETFDFLQCSHVLEHVDDDRKALREFWRILKPNGYAILLVPINGQVTHEDLSITSPIEREKAFGQHDHVRFYGLDFIKRASEARFKVKSINVLDLVTDQEVLHYGLEKRDIIFLCQKII